MSDCSYSMFRISIKLVYFISIWWLHSCICHMKLLLSKSWCTSCGHHTTMYQFTVSFIQNPYVGCMFAVTCHLHIWDQGLLHAAVVRQGWNRYLYKNLHRKLTLEKRILLPLLLGLKPATFWLWVWRRTTQLPLHYLMLMCWLCLHTQTNTNSA